jgi:branched-chain amino acid transport system ATP-binding protein
VLRELSLDVAEGEFVALLGRNGAGKTTTMRAIAGLVPFQGSIMFKGRALDGIPVHNIVSLGVAFAQEGKPLFTELSVQDNLTLGAYAQRGRQQQVQRDMERVFGLFPVLERKIRDSAETLSGGEQQMLVLAQAIMAHPRLLMVDEPSQGLAPALVSQVLAALTALRDEGTAILLAEQVVDKTLPICDRLYVLDLGQVVLEGNPEAVAKSRALREVYIGHGG